jgi:uncharacterized membrane protein YoaK (UPF0700 family)
MGPGKTAGVALILAFLSGFVDTAAFIHMQGLFVAHVTGNFVLLGAAAVAGGGAAVAGKGPEILQLAALPVFFVAAMLTGALAMRLSPERGLAVILWSAALLMIGVGGVSAGLGAGPWDGLSAMVLIAAMGMLNAAHRLNAGMGPPFAVMTGNVAALAIRAAVLLHLAPRPTEGGGGAGEIKMLRAVIGFAAGCAAGAVAQLWLGLAAVAIPALLLGMRLAWRG